MSEVRYMHIIMGTTNSQQHRVQSLNSHHILVYALYFVSQYGHINFMFPLLAQVRILASICKMSFLNQNFALF
jgi:hypothetical protein